MQVASILSWLEAKYGHPPDTIWCCRNCSVMEEMQCWGAIAAISLPSKAVSWLSIPISLRTRLFVPRDDGTHR